MNGQLKWCMKAGLPAGSLACRLDQVQEFLAWNRGFEGTNMTAETRLMEQDAKAVRRALRREVPEAAQVEETVRRVSKALKPKGLPLDEALKEARKAIVEAQRALKTAISKASKTKCRGAELPQEVETFFRTGEFRAKEAGLQGRKQ
jgi:hypothetical protein